MRRYISLLLAVILVIALLPANVLAAEGGIQNFSRDGSYTPDTFGDVPETSWYAENVAAAYELGLMKGNGDGFAPNGNVTLAEAVAMASRLHRTYHEGSADFVQGSPWYQVYVDYADENGIVAADEFADWLRPATRAEMAHIFASALPAAELAEWNAVETLPDVNADTEYSEDIFLLYRAGVLTGNDAEGTFTPNDTIIRCQVAAIVSRIALPELRRGYVEPEEPVEPIQPLGFSRALTDINAVDGIEPYSEYWYNGSNTISGDLSASPALAYSLTFSDITRFPSEGKLPAGYDPDALLEWGKYPGLNIDILHKHGFTGEGAVIAYVDQPYGRNEQYNGANVHYTNNTSSSSSMHGPAVLSLLAGKDIGTAPNAEIYYYAHASWLADQSTHAECLYQIIEQNESLPEGEKITMVGFSDNIDPREKNAAAFREAVAACEDAGIMVWFCADYAAASFLPYSDKNNYLNLVPDHWMGYGSEAVYVPAAGRTTAATESGASYIYWSTGGLSWTMPYVLGLYGIAVEIDPELTQDDLLGLLSETAYINNGMRIINPVGFVAAVLQGVGRGAEAEVMLAEVAARTSYLYAVMDTAAMTEEDLSAVGGYLASITDATVLVADASSFKNAEELYTALQADASERGGSVAGVQIFGTPGMVPAFEVRYKAQMSTGIDEAGMYVTDLFYGNFDNDAALISNGYNVMDHFAEGWDVNLIPEWPVARLPLSSGQFSAFFEKYDTFVTETGLVRRDIVNFSNPIFASSYHTDDMSAFLNRMSKDFKMLDVPYRLYGNLDGQYPVTTKVLGGFTTDNLAAENDAGIVEFIINSHGQWNNVDQCIFERGEEKRISFINMDTINDVLDGEAYYLDFWTCLNGYGMENNLTTTALEGQSVGVFSATEIISNNGVNYAASLSKMKQSNFYYFYYSYLAALHEGKTRGDAFFSAQKAYGEALIEDSENGIRSGEGNYQFNLNNLLVYHNFGVIEPSAASAYFDASGYIAQAGQSVPKQQIVTGNTESAPSADNLVTDGTPAGDEQSLSVATMGELLDGSYTVHDSTMQKLDNDHIRFTITFTAPEGGSIHVFSPPNGEVFMNRAPHLTSGEKETVTFDLSFEDIRAAGNITISFVFSGDNDRFFVFMPMDSILKLMPNS